MNSKVSNENYKKVNKNKSINTDKYKDNSTEKISNYSNNNDFLILEDINTNFA